MPRLGIGALGSLAVAVGPGGDATQTALVFGFQQLLNNEARAGREEFFGSIADLLVNYFP